MVQSWQDSLRVNLVHYYSIHMFDNALNRKDQKLYAAGDTDDEPEVLESVEVCLVDTSMRPVS